MKKLMCKGLIAALCGSLTTVLGGEPSAPPPVVYVAPVRLAAEAAPKRYAGAVESIEHVDIMPRITGTLFKVNFREGSLVKKGDLLYVLEDTTYRAAVDGLKAQKEQLEAALKFADSEYQRNHRLVVSRAVAVSAYDKAVLEIDSAKAKIKEIEASLLNAENNLSYTRIYAPIDGRIGINIYPAGNLITPSAGKMTDIVMVAPIYVRFSISERVFRQDFGGLEGIRQRAAVRVRLADNSVYPEVAHITLIDNKISSSSNTITLRATFENKDHQLIPGSFVTVLLSAKADKPFISVMPSALIAESDGYYVYVVDKDNKAVRRKVRTGPTAGGYQIILDGLHENERVIVDGTHKVQPGMTVSPVDAPAMK